MSCEYCRDENRYLMTREVIFPHPFIDNLKGDEIQEKFLDSIFVIIDIRGYLRLCTVDNNCLDSGEKIKINFCPICGEWLTDPDKEI